MVYKADLHIHSTASDGQYTPAELAELVKKRGAEVWALTDHDSVSGVDEAVQASERLGLRMIRGVELSADDYLNLHILGYDFTVSLLQAWLDSLKGGRNDRKYRIRDFLRTKGLEISLDEVDEETAGGAIGLLAGQWAKLLGAGRAAIKGRNEAKRNFVGSCGLEYLTDTAGEQFDRVIEAVGSETALTESSQLTAPGGRLVLMGNPDGPRVLSQDTYWRILRKQLTLTGTWNSSYSSNHNDWQEAMQAMLNGKLQSKELRCINMNRIFSILARNGYGNLSINLRSLITLSTLQWQITRGSCTTFRSI